MYPPLGGWGGEGQLGHKPEKHPFQADFTPCLGDSWISVFLQLGHKPEKYPFLADFTPCLGDSWFSIFLPPSPQGGRGGGAARSQTRKTCNSSRFHAMFGRFVTPSNRLCAENERVGVGVRAGGREAGEGDVYREGGRFVFLFVFFLIVFFHVI